MCFSAEASLSAAAILAVVGALTIKSTRNKKQLLVAAIPLLFAIQQFAEGVIWLSVGKMDIPPEARTIAEYTFLAFAFLVWPVWLPLSFYVMEDTPWRKKTIAVILAGGIALSLFNLFYLPGSGIEVKVMNHSIQYSSNSPQLAYSLIIKVLYHIAVVVPALLSSYNFMWLWGLIVLASSLTADYFYTTTFTSVWCFFSALISGGLYFVLNLNNATVEKGNRTRGRN